MSPLLEKVNGDNNIDSIIEKLLLRLQSIYMALNIPKPNPLPSFERCVHKNLIWNAELIKIIEIKYHSTLSTLGQKPDTSLIITSHWSQCQICILSLKNRGIYVTKTSREKISLSGLISLTYRTYAITYTSNFILFLTTNHRQQTQMMVILTMMKLKS